mgnify:CR=1 FL=1
MSFYGAVRSLVGALIPLVADLRVEGRGRVPEQGPFLLVANHRSILDPVLAQVACPRPVHTMTKSTQFGRAPFGWLLPRLRTFPVRRYRVDPQAVRTALRLLEQGRGVGVYPEGERSWDGRAQPFRRGTVRLILKAGVPVVPCGISGSYEVWPRWSHRPVKGPVSVRFGEPLHLGRHDDRREREAAFEDARTRLRSALTQLVEEWE